ncbi:MAG: LrgA family protein [Proteobacteria bacterium]|nr:LrgA family protein [Pseudomonadota bacterium]
MNHLKNTLRQCVIVFGCLAVAELFVSLTGIRFPSALIGMLLLTLLLKLGWVKLDWVQGIADFLLGHLGLFFVPPGVALMLHFELIRAEWLPIAVATLVSTVAVLALTGWAYQLARRCK